MDMLKIVLFAALPEEYREFKRRIRPWQQLSRMPFRKYGCTLAEKRLVLVETGMGKEQLLRCMALAMQEESPDLIVSFGFAGSLTAALPVGGVAMGADFLYRGKATSSGSELKVHTDVFDGTVRDFCRDHNVTMARILTVDRPLPKHQLNRCSSSGPTLMDMESFFAARFAQEAGVPFFCFRSVSDGLQDEIEYDLDEISWQGKIRIRKVLMLVAKRPHLLKAFYASWRRSVMAGRELANVLAQFLNLPAAKLTLIGSDRRYPNKAYSTSAAIQRIPPCEA